MTAEEFLKRAKRSAASASLLIEAGDANGACNRAYYAMFEAARAALQANGVSNQPEFIKTHSGLIAAFSLHLVKPGIIAAELGRSLSKINTIRLAADCSDAETDHETAQWAVTQAAVFVAAIDDALPAGAPS